MRYWFVVLGYSVLLFPVRAVAAESAILDKVYITGGAEQILTQPGSATLIDQEQLEEFEYTDIHRILMAVPGVNIQEEDGYGLRPNIGLRGTSPDRSKKVTLMEDGILSGPAPYSSPAAYYFPNVSRMSAVEVFKGPSAIKYGPATIGGAVNLVSRQIPFAAEGEADIQFGDNNFQRYNVWYGEERNKTGYLLEGLRVSSDGFKELDGGGDTGFVRNDLNLKLSYDFRDKFNQTIILKAGYSDEVSDETYLGLTRNDLSADPYRRYAASALDRMDWQHGALSINHSFDVRGQTVTTDIYRNTFERDWFKINSFGGNGPSLQAVLKDPTGINEEFYRVLTGAQASANDNEQLLLGSNDREYISQGIQSRINIVFDALGLQHDFEAGVRLHNDYVERHHTEAAYDMQVGGQLQQDGGIYTTLKNRSEATALALYVQNSITLNNTTVSLGLRSEQIDTEEKTYNNLSGALSNEVESSESVLLPGIGIYSQLSPASGIFAGIYRGYSATTPGKDGTTDPEASTNYELGARYFGVMGRAEVVAFFNDYTDLTGTCSFSNGCDNALVDSQLNAGAAEVYGVETGWSHHLIVQRFTIPLSFTYTYSKGEFAANFSDANGVFGDRNNDIQAGESLANLPEHRLNVQAGVEFGKLAVNISTLYQSEMRDTPGKGTIPASERIGSYAVTDISLRYAAVNNFEFYATVDNVFDNDYVVASKPYGYRPGKPQTIHGGIKVSF